MKTLRQFLAGAFAMVVCLAAQGQAPDPLTNWQLVASSLLSQLRGIGHWNDRFAAATCREPVQAIARDTEFNWCRTFDFGLPAHPLQGYALGSWTGFVQVALHSLGACADALSLIPTGR